MVLLLWAGLISASVGVGAAGALALTAPRGRDGIFVYAGLASLAAGVVTAWRFEPLHDSTALFAAAVVLSCAAVGLGFTLVSALLPYVRPRMAPAVLPDPGSQAATLVLLLVDTRYPAYRPEDVTAEIAESVAAGFREPSLAVLPFHYAAEKARYRAIGGTNPEAATASLLGERLESRLVRDAFAGPVIVRCADEGALAAAVADARRRGFSSIVALGAFITDSGRVLAQRRVLEAQLDTRSDPSIVWTAPLWTSDELAALVSTAALPLADGGLRTGVALLIRGHRGRSGSGRAPETHEDRFADRVRTHLIEAGLDGFLIRTCSVEWGEPGVTETIRHLAALGSQRIVTVPVSYPFDGLETLFDVPSATRVARIHEDVHVVHAQAWGGTQTAADLLAAAVRQAASAGASRA